MTAFEKLRRTLAEKPSATRIIRGVERRARGFGMWARWNLERQYATNLHHLSRYKDKHRGERCVIVGNGPSLNRTNLSLLSGTTTFGLNRIYLLFDKSGFRPDYVCCFNDLVLSQFHEELSSMGIPLFVNASAHRELPPSAAVMHLLERFTPKFRPTVEHGLWGGGTVTFVAMQLAFYMGFERVVLVGVDHNFSAHGEANRRVRSGRDDNDHFDARYFGKGILWHLPDLATSEWAYEMAREAFEEAGRSIVDATVDGKLQVFPKVTLEEEFR